MTKNTTTGSARLWNCSCSLRRFTSRFCVSHQGYGTRWDWMRGDWLVGLRWVRGARGALLTRHIMSLSWAALLDEEILLKRMQMTAMKKSIITVTPDMTTITAGCSEEEEASDVEFVMVEDCRNKF